jgi:protein phosphatase methylesterase 1
MMGVISNRPSSFRSIQEAISWSGRTGQCKSKEAASISLPSQLVQSDIEVVVEKSGSSGGGSGAPRPPNLPCPAAAVGGGVTVMPSIGEDEEEQEEEEAARSKEGQEGDVKETVKESVWTWRTPLLLSQPHWTSWYRGLSDAFLSLTCPKMLMLAGSDRLDKELTIGQMQGKFQLSMMPNAGHAIQEDESGKVAEALVQFVQRFRIGLPPMAIPKAPFGTERVLPVAVGMPFKP